jgi:hypothetical protein
MANDFVKEVGILDVVCKKPDGEIRFEYSGENTILQPALVQIPRILGGSAPAFGAGATEFRYPLWRGNYITDDADYTMTDGPGIYIVDTASQNSLLLCGLDGWTNQTDWVATGLTNSTNPISSMAPYAGNSFLISGTGSLYNNNTMSWFHMGHHTQANQNQIAIGPDVNLVHADYFQHVPTGGTFAYSIGDTITINWSVSFT